MRLILLLMVMINFSEGRPINSPREGGWPYWPNETPDNVLPDLKPKFVRDVTILMFDNASLLMNIFLFVVFILCILTISICFYGCCCERSHRGQGPYTTPTHPRCSCGRKREPKRKRKTKKKEVKAQESEVKECLDQSKDKDEKYENKENIRHFLMEDSTEEEEYFYIPPSIPQPKVITKSKPSKTCLNAFNLIKI
uniref:Uncharacterized protein n=1 Tax=Clastoptera arizonana TaxID=38151 RepID=A0A1B6CRS3_9HEMI